ncbi:unnamed protein product [Malus baccata var. baccata]
MAAKSSRDSSSSSYRCSYHAFLSFRGKDTRKGFTDHLYRALELAGIHTFRDDDEIKRGESIESELEKAIQESQVSIIVFSKDYASSRWCLNELLKIVERRNTDHRHVVLPVFYDVDPSDVRKQSGTFAEAFARHEERFSTEEMDKVELWRRALRDVASLGGMVLGDRYEGQFIQDIGTENIKGLMLNLASKRTFVGSDNKRCHAEDYDGNCSRRRRLGFFSWKPVSFSSTNSASASNEIDFKSEAFRRMHNLEILMLNNVNVRGSYEEFSKKLVCLSWRGFHLKSIPENFCLENLVVLDMRNSSLQHVWNETRVCNYLSLSLSLTHTHTHTHTN